MSVENRNFRHSGAARYLNDSYDSSFWF
jgi:hypothetical protein